MASICLEKATEDARRAYETMQAAFNTVQDAEIPNVNKLLTNRLWFEDTSYCLTNAVTAHVNTVSQDRYIKTASVILVRYPRLGAGALEEVP